MESKPTQSTTQSSSSTSSAASTSSSIGEKASHLTESAADAARDVAQRAQKATSDAKARASDVMTRVRTTARGAADDVRDFGEHLPENVSTYRRAIEEHIQANPRLDLGIVAVASGLAGAFFGGRIVRLALFGVLAYGASRLYPMVDAAVQGRDVENA